jgi:O-antigen/teichoic acid export membrane protein
MHTAKQDSLGGGRRLLRNSAFNIAGYVLPLLAALLTIPLLVRGLGTDRFGFLALAWTLLGYASLFDLGLGRALVKFAAEEIEPGSAHTDWPTIRAGLLLMAGLGIVIGTLLALIAPALVGGLIKVSDALREEAVRAMYLLALSVPFVTHTSGLRAILEAKHRFGLVNAVRIPLGVLTFAGPLAVLPFSASLESVIGVLFGLRMIAWAAHFRLATRVSPELLGAPGFRQPRMRLLLGMGAWVTVSNILGPIFLYADRFMIAGIASIAAVTYYVTPWEVVTKLLVYPGALIAVLFPIFAAWSAREPVRALRYYEAGLRYVFLGMFPFVLLVITFAREGLQLWLGADFAKESARVAQMLCLGVLANGVAQVPFAYLQASGKAGLAARMHMIQLPLFLVAMYVAVTMYGILGAAVVWSCRVIADLLVMHVMARRSLPPAGAPGAVQRLGMGVALISLGVPLGLESLPAKAAYAAAVTAGFGAFVWLALVKPEEKSLLKELVLLVRRAG